MPRNLTALRELDRLVRSAPADKVALDRICRPHRTGPIMHPIGWMATDPWFRTNTEIGKWLTEKCEQTFRTIDSTCPLFQAVLRIFGLVTVDANRLFGYERYAPSFEPVDISKDDFLDNLGRVIAGDVAMPYELLWRERRMEMRSA